MTTILLNTTINASIETCFKISLDVGIHERSMDHTGERAIAGRKSGICELNDEITWEAKHFGIRQKLCVRITKVRSPFFF